MNTVCTVGRALFDFIQNAVFTPSHEIIGIHLETRMQTMMKALVKREAAKGIWMEQVPLPEIGPNDVLVKLEKTAICGTDLHIYKWDEWSQRTIKPGLVIGHEFVGRIVDMGAGVRGYTIGQRVSAEGHIVCGVCRNCRAGKQHLCPHTIGI